MSEKARASPGDPSFTTHVTGASNVLVLVPSITPDDTDTCVDLLSNCRGGAVAVLRLDFHRSPADLLLDWPRTVGATLTKAGVVSVGQQAETGAKREEQYDSCPFDVNVKRLGDPRNLTGIGVAVTEILQDWGDEFDQLVFCFHSLTPLLYYADVDKAYQFTHSLTGHMTRLNASAHYHMDPNAHEASTIHTFKTLFDGVIEIDDDGKRRVLTS